MVNPQQRSISNSAFASIAVVTLAVTLCLICCAPGARAQSASATLSGLVVDQNGAVIPGATLMVVNPNTGFTRETTTSDEGVYTFPPLAPGSYSLTVRREGFAPVEVKDVVLNVNDQRSLQIQLKVGQIGGETVVVNAGEASLVNESPAVGTVVDCR